MNKFWEWMEKMGYGFRYKDYKNLEIKCVKNHNIGGEDMESPTQQMLIGYMIEYVLEQGKYCEGFIFNKGVQSTYEMLEEEIQTELTEESVKI